VFAREYNASLETLGTLDQHAAPVDAVMCADGFEGCELIVVDFDTR
jgi:hypothetical protein